MQRKKNTICTKKKIQKKTKKKKKKKQPTLKSQIKKKKTINKKHQLQHPTIKHNENALQQNKYHVIKHLNLHWLITNPLNHQLKT